MEREELEAAVLARREVGAELEPELIDGFLERVGKSIDARVDERLGLAERSSGGGHASLAVPLGSLGIAIPLTGAGGGTAGTWAILVVWIGIVFVNVAYALGRR